MSEKSKTILRIEHISKSFGSLKALDDVSMEIKSGEILAILGENGAGKSTLMKILSGLYQPDEGHLSLNRNWFNFEKETKEEFVSAIMENPRFAMLLGIGQVYQHFQLVETFNVTENIILGKEYTYKNSILLDNKTAETEVKKISEQFGLPINPKSIVEDLPVGLKQRVEILKQLYRDSNLLILDEPTAVLTPKESEELFKTMRKLKSAGKSIIFISHKLHEPLAIADRIITIRRGKVVGEVLPKDATKELLAEMIVGRKIIQQLDRKKSKNEHTVFDVQNLFVKGIYGQNVVKDVTFVAKSHRILGIAGVQGNGQTELLDALMGLKKVEHGSVFFIDEKEDILNITNFNTSDRFKIGIGYIPEDRTTQGLISQFDLSNNIWMGFFHNKHQAEQYLIDEGLEQPQEEVNLKTNKEKSRYYFNKLKEFVLLPSKIMKILTKSVISKLDVRGGNEHTKLADLSGGNQQKILIGREFAKNPRLIIASQPTRGVDVGVMQMVHEELITMRNDGVCIILVSSDLDEILKLSDDIIVMYEGEVAGYGELASFTIDQISQMMTSGKFEEVVK